MKSGMGLENGALWHKPEEETGKPEEGQDGELADTSVNMQEPASHHPLSLCPGLPDPASQPLDSEP